MPRDWSPITDVDGCEFVEQDGATYFTCAARLWYRLPELKEGCTLNDYNDNDVVPESNLPMARIGSTGCSDTLLADAIFQRVLDRWNPADLEARIVESYRSGRSAPSLRDAVQAGITAALGSAPMFDIEAFAQEIREEMMRHRENDRLDE